MAKHYADNVEKQGFAQESIMRAKNGAYALACEKKANWIQGAQAWTDQRWFKDRKDADELRERYVERYADRKVPAENFRIIERDVVETFRFSAP